MNGFMGEILRINLTTKKISKEPLNFEYARKYLGGTGLGIRMAYDEVPPNTDPMDKKAKLFFFTGPLTNTSLGTTGRYQVIFKSPLTGILCDSSSSGYWGSELKKCGYDGLIIEGISDTKVYININENTVEIKDATKHWGKDTFTIQSDLKQEISDSKARIATIGSAGEKGILYACIMNDEGRVAGRGGCGAVMGSKNLKAIVVSGKKETSLSDPVNFKQIAVEINRRNAKTPWLGNLREFGTAGVLDTRWCISDVPFKNWAVSSIKEICLAIGGKKLLELMPGKHNACYKCSIGCARWVKIDEGPYKMDAPGPEYESLSALGTLCMIGDLKAISYANHLCNRYGMDTITCGSTIAFAMECYEKGLLKRSDLDGIELTWGNEIALLEMIHKIGNNEGAGRLLGLGSRKLAEKIGDNSINFAVQVKGLELPMHDARAGFGWACNYATSPRGGCHLHGMTSLYEDKEDPIPEWGFLGKYKRWSNEGKAEMTRFAQNWAHVLDSLVMCYFATFSLQPSDFCNLLNSALGWDIKPLDLLQIGDRINALYRSYNYRCGIRRKDDDLPPRAMMALKDGGAAGKVPDIKMQIERYYKLRHWDEDGKPNKEELIKLGLEDIVKDLF